MRRVGSIAIISVLIAAGIIGVVSLTSEEVKALNWSVEVVDATPGVGRFTSIALDSQEYPHISYFDDVGQDLKYARWDGALWNIEVVDTANLVGEDTSIILDDLDHPHISYYEKTNSIVKYATWNGTAWRIDVVDTRTSVFGGGDTSIALNDSGYPHISYSLDYSLKLAKWDGVTWNMEIIDTVGSVGHYSSLALNKSGYAHISHYYQDTGDLRYANWTGSTWNKYSIEVTGVVGGFTSIELDSREYPRISYYDNTSKNLKYAHWENNLWTKEVVDSTSHTGLFTSLEIDDMDYPHISYYEYLPGQDLMYARWDGSMWIIEEVDTVGDVGWYTSMVLDKYGNPHISYFDYSNWILKYAKAVMNTPTNPLDLYATADDALVLLTWNPPASAGATPITNYRVYRGTSSGGESFLTEIGNITTYTDLSVVNGQTYYYMVSAKNSNGEGPKSNEVIATPTPPPGAPAFNVATLIGGNQEHVNLEWTLSSDDGGGYDSVIEYELYRGMVYDTSGLGYGMLTTFLPGTTNHFDIGVGHGDPNNYFYLLCARNFNNQSNCVSEQAGKYTRPMSLGVNLVSIPLVQSDTALQTVLQTITFNKIWTYDSLQQEWEWSATFKPYLGGLSDPSQATGLWIEVTQPSDLTIAGIVPSITMIPLLTGWNLVAFPSFNASYTVADLKFETGATEVEGFHIFALPYCLKRMMDGDALQAGYAYWVKVDIQTIWTVSN
jgi:hypothetical protein